MSTATGIDSTAVPGPVAGTRMTESFVRQIARFAYFWAWPMVNMYNRFLAYEKVPGPGLAGGVLAVAPPNHLCMLRDYIEPSEPAVACPEPGRRLWPKRFRSEQRARRHPGSRLF
jgi:hypothetical protein